MISAFTYNQQKPKYEFCLFCSLSSILYKIFSILDRLWGPASLLFYRYWVRSMGYSRWGMKLRTSIWHTS